MKEEKAVLMIVDDDPGIREQLKWCFTDDYLVVTASNRQEAIATFRRYHPRVVTLDLGMPPDVNGSQEGLATLEEIMALSPMTKVILITGQQDHPIAVRAIGLGAYDFYEKPIEWDVIRLILDRANHVWQLESDYRTLDSSQRKCIHCGIISDDPEMDKICTLIEKVAPTNATTLLEGESGTGKEILARAVHSLSERSEGPFVAINCAAIPENLLESELFGFEKGAFTGAGQQHKGRIERANGGTLFLDEIGDLPLSLQPKLLRFLQEKTLQRLGGEEEQQVNVRVVCATHQNLAELIQKNAFREDLFYRISEISVSIPPLRERQGDIILLARMFLLKFSEELKKPVKGFLNDALQAMEAYAWPGNVRQLENCIKRAMIVGEGAWIQKSDLLLPEGEAVSLPFSLREVRDEAERTSILRALQHAEGNVSRAAELLGVTRPTLYNLMEKLDIREKAST